MSQVLQEALGQPFLQASETDAHVRDWKSGPSHVRPGLMAWAWDRVRYVGSLLQAQESHGGRFLDLQIDPQIAHRKMSWDAFDDGTRPLDVQILQIPKVARQPQVIYRQRQEEKDGVQRVLNSEGKCCAFVTVRGEVFLGPPDVRKADGLYCINKNDEKHLRILRLAEASPAAQRSGVDSPDNDSNGLEVIGQVLRFEESAETTFVQELKKAAQLLIEDSST